MTGGRTITDENNRFLFGAIGGLGDVGGQTADLVGAAGGGLVAVQAAAEAAAGEAGGLGHCLVVILSFVCRMAGREVLVLI